MFPKEISPPPRRVEIVVSVPQSREWTIHRAVIALFPVAGRCVRVQGHSFSVEAVATIAKARRQKTSKVEQFASIFVAVVVESGYGLW
mmetsp:Transcript_106793/g.298949  ORF Transcript_106793/g.298949 Transcript_106793/m.298949 type:complete len:88 (+) Transcript_106793:1501-1764(+)